MQFLGVFVRKKNFQMAHGVRRAGFPKMPFFSLGQKGTPLVLGVQKIIIELEQAMVHVSKRFLARFQTYGGATR